MLPQLQVPEFSFTPPVYWQVGIGMQSLDDVEPDWLIVDDGHDVHELPLLNLLAMH